MSQDGRPGSRSGDAWPDRRRDESQRRGDWVHDPEFGWINTRTGEPADGVTSHVLDITCLLDEHDDAITQVAEQVAALRRDFGEQLATLNAKARRTSPSRWSWRHATGSPRTQLWLELSEFVDWLITRYELQAGALYIPPCWYEHPVAVEELTALMAAWRAAYCNGDTATADMANWHQHYRVPTIERLQRTAHWSACTQGEHVPAHDVEITDSAFAEHCADDRERHDPGVIGDPARPRADDHDARRPQRQHMAHGRAVLRT